MPQYRPDSLDFLLQLDVTDDLLPRVGKSPWQTLYLNGDQPPHRFGMWCALLDEKTMEHAMTTDSWDLRIGDGGPGFSVSWIDGRRKIAYQQSGNEGIWPLVHFRSFHNAFPDYCEIDEEFRLYHNLAHDTGRGLLISFDESGREIEVARITASEVRVALKYLRQFQAATRLHLAIYFDSIRFSPISFDEVPQAEHKRHSKGDVWRWNRAIDKCTFREEYSTLSHVLAKTILAPPSVESSGKWPFDENDEPAEVEFIIGIDSEGEPIKHTSNPDKLNNLFGKNPDAPSYLTPVYFRRDVLATYYADPARFKVVDGQLICLGLWSCQIDNDLPSRVAVFLGDLGRDLPYDERMHWRAFNVPPEEGISETSYRRSILGEFAEARSYDLVFRRLYVAVAEQWEKRHGWPLFLPPSATDTHLLETVRIPVTESQNEFDELVMHLAKLLIDSLNEKELAQHTSHLPDNPKGIDKFEGFAVSTELPEEQRYRIVASLRRLQNLRSTGSAHRKGSAHLKAMTELGAPTMSKAEISRSLLKEACTVLLILQDFYCE